VAKTQEEPVSPLQHERFREYAATQTTPYEVDETGGIIKNVLVLGMQSRGTGVYTHRVMEEALPQYADKPTFINHTRDGSHPRYESKLGVHRNPRMSPEGIRTDFHFNPAHACASQLIWDAKNDPKNVGFSHDADCSYRIENGKRIVHAIEKVYSIDLVTKPGTTGGMWEEEEIAPENKALAVSTLAGLDHIRTVLYSEDVAPADRRDRLIEAAVELHGELLEGEIADEIKQDATHRKLRKINETAQDFICRAMWDDALYRTLADKKTRILAVLADWETELQALSGATGSATLQEEEPMGVDYKEVDLGELTKQRPDLVAKIAGTDETSRLKEEATTLKATVDTQAKELAKLRAKETARLKESEIAAELKAAGFPVDDAVVFSKRFQEQLAAAPDKTAREELMADRMELAKGRLQEAAAVIPTPMAELRPLTQGQASGGFDHRYDSVFGAPGK